MRWPDVAVGVGSVLLIAALVWGLLGSNHREPQRDTVIPFNLRQIHQSMLLYGLDNGDYLPGLTADGSLLTNAPAERFDLLVESNYLTADLLVSPADARPDAAYSYAMLDIGEPGARRAAWTTAAAPDAVILAESPAAVGVDDPTDWSGWVVWHSGYLSAASAQNTTEKLDGPRVQTRYAGAGPFNEADDLFAAEGSEDAYLISPSR